jgi:hypothetical protein
MKTKFTLEEKSGESDRTEGETRTIGIAKSDNAPRYRRVLHDGMDIKFMLWAVE